MRNILFVDNDLEVLKGVERSLKSHKSEWNIQVCSDPDRALELMSEKKIDLVVSDLRMSSMHGNSFLNIVSQRHPHTIRFTLTGETDELTMINSLKGSHQLILKPCSSVELEKKISDVLRSKEFVDDRVLIERITHLNALPTIPSLYLELTEELKSDDYTLPSIAKIIERDLGMSLQLLKVVNSPFFGVRSHVSSIKNAVMFLGTDYIRSIVLASKLFEQAENISNIELVKTVFQTSQYIAGLVKELAEANGLSKEECADTYMAAMLQNIGILILLKVNEDVFEDITSFTKTTVTDVYAKENKTFKANHDDVGAYLLCLWGFDQKIINAVAFRNLPSKCKTDHNVILTFLHVANVLILGSDFDEVYLMKNNLFHKIDDFKMIAQNYSNQTH